MENNWSIEMGEFRAHIGYSMLNKENLRKVDLTRLEYHTQKLTQ